MNKRLSHYQIFMIIMTTIMAGILLLMGVIAMNKSMTLKLAFEINPSIKIILEMAEIDEEGEVGEFKPIFQNSGTPLIENGITLSGNTLSFGNAYAKGLGANFALKITNLTESMVLAEFSGASYDKSYLIFEPSGSEAQQVKVSAVSVLTIDFTQVVVVSIIDNSNGGLTLSTTEESSLIKVNDSYLQNNGVYYAELGKEISLYYELGASYKNNSISASVGGQQVACGSTSITISATNATSNITITLQAELSGFEITLNYNDGVTSSKTISGAYTQLPSTLEVPTRAGYTFAGWYSDEIAETDLPSDQILYYSYSYLEDTPALTPKTTKTLEDDITLHARWLPYTINTYESGHVWEGYKYITFANKSEGTFTNSDGTTSTQPLNWIIIGAGESVNSAVFRNATRPTDINEAKEKTELNDNDVLVLSEYVVKKDSLMQDANLGVYCLGSLHDYLNNEGEQNFLYLSGLYSYKDSYVVKKNIVSYDRRVDEDYVFVLANSGSDNGAEQTYCVQTYLGEAYSSNSLYTTFCGASTETWWLRSFVPVVDIIDYLTPFVYSNNYSFDDVWSWEDSNKTDQIALREGTEVCGVRPCFVLNLA